ncbi:3-phenylpropionate/cinnamic acid dioxygenase subunit beta [Microbacterium sp. X-17]|uniref:aromatic-ring-hydroxylating dioxygenase subunit beta n=1 Tax=Microbacterium sp. X-17 TaxID=3144404 RepID=UPI0031F51E0C
MTRAVEVDLELRLLISDLLVQEAEYLDDRRFEDWLALFTEDVRYTAPIRVARKSPAPDIIDEIGHFDDTYQSLDLRVRRLRTDVAWAEDPPSHTRRLITNIRIRLTDVPDELDVRSNLLLFRSRGDRGQYDLIVGERQDRFRKVGDEWKISRRRAILDQSSLSTKNLGVFL